MSFPVRPSFNVTKGGIRSSTGTRSSARGGHDEGGDSDINVIIPLSLLHKLQSSLREEQAVSAYKEQQITQLHALLHTTQQPHHSQPPRNDDSAVNRCLQTLLDLTRMSADYYYKRSKELERVLMPLLDPDNQRWHFPYADAENYVVECVEGLTYVKISHPSGEFIDMVLPEEKATIYSQP